MYDSLLRYQSYLHSGMDEVICYNSLGKHWDIDIVGRGFKVCLIFANLTALNLRSTES